MKQMSAERTRFGVLLGTEVFHLPFCAGAPNPVAKGVQQRLRGNGSTVPCS